MIIDEKREQDSLILNVKGRLDTTTAPMLEEKLKGRLEGITRLVMDFSLLEYISSAGLRVLLSVHKELLKQDGRLVIRNANEEVMDVFTITGFSEKLILE